MSSQNAFPVSRGNGLLDEGKIVPNRTRLIFLLNNPVVNKYSLLATSEGKEKMTLKKCNL